MAWRFRNLPIVSGEVVHPDVWAQNHMAYAGEFNGRLDRDNLPSNLGIRQNSDYEEPWVTKNFKKACFHEIYSDSFDGTVANRFFFREGYAGWASLQKDIDAKSGSTGRIGRVNFTSEHEGLVVAHWTGWLVGEPNFGPANSQSGNPERDGLSGDDFYKRGAKFANFRILVNGREVANSGKHSAAWPNQCVSMTGAAPVEAGEVTVTVQGRAGVFKDLEFDAQAFQDERKIFAIRSRELLVIFKKR